MFDTSVRLPLTFVIAFLMSETGFLPGMVFHMRDENDPRALKTPDNWLPAILEWVRLLKAENSSANTIDKRTDHIRRLARAYPNSTPETFDAQNLIDWVSDQKWAPETRHSYYSSMRKFFAFVQGEQHNVADILPRIKRDQPPPRPCPEDILNQALSVAPPRERLILVLASAVGLRASEIVRVHIRDLQQDLVGTSLYVHGKGDRHRFVPLPSPLDRIVFRACVKGNGFAFPGRIDGHLSAHYASKIAGAYLEPPWTLHTLRHRFATRAYSVDRDLLAVKQLLGHKSVATTQRYAAVPDGAIRNALTATMPKCLISGT